MHRAFCSNNWQLTVSNHCICSPACLCCLCSNSAVVCVAGFCFSYQRGSTGVVLQLRVSSRVSYFAAIHLPKCILFYINTAVFVLIAKFSPKCHLAAVNVAICCSPSYFHFENACFLSSATVNASISAASPSHLPSSTVEAYGDFLSTGEFFFSGCPERRPVFV